MDYTCIDALTKHINSINHYLVVVIGMEKKKLDKTLKISSEVHCRLMNFAKKSETLDEAIERLLDVAEGKERKA